MIGTIGLTGALLLGGCNSTTDNGSGSGTSNASATGIWSGSDSVSGLSVTALSNAAGEATFIRSDGTQFTGTSRWQEIPFCSSQGTFRVPSANLVMSSELTAIVGGV